MGERCEKFSRGNFVVNRAAAIAASEKHHVSLSLPEPLRNRGDFKPEAEDWRFLARARLATYAGSRLVRTVMGNSMSNPYGRLGLRG